MKKRLLAGLIVVCTLLLAGRVATQNRRAVAAPADFTLGVLNCFANPGAIPIVNQAAAAATLDQLSLSISSGGATGTTVSKRIIDTVAAPGVPGGNYAVPNAGTVVEQVGPGASQSPPPPAGAGLWPAPPVATFTTTTQNLVFSLQPLLAPGAIVTLFDQTTSTTIATQQCPSSQSQFVFTVSPRGFDTLPSGNPNPFCGPDLPTGVAPSDANPGPCLTIQHAIDLANDGQTILVEAGDYEVCKPIEVNKLVRITTIQNAANGIDVNPATPVVAGGLGVGSATVAANLVRNHVVLHSFQGNTVFHVTAVGFPSVNSPSNFPNAAPANVVPGTLINNNYHVLIDGFTIGGAFNPGSAAVFLDNDANTDVRDNVIGGEAFSNATYTGVPCGTPPVFPPLTNPTSVKSESMANAADILLQDSDHANIFNNALLGSSFFSFSPILGVTGSTPQTGFGVATTECLGLGSDASDEAQITFNLIDKDSNAGIWLCSDGGGGHLISNNTVRNNGRGIVLRAISDTLLDADTVSNNFQDGIVIYDAASNNTIQRSLVESHNTPGAAGIRIGDFGAGLFPLQTAINSNTLRRNWTGIVIAGARNTSGSGNIITSEAVRTGILLQLGSTGSPTLTQPTGTSFRLNQIVSNGGQCNAQQGCAIRLDQGVTTSVDATQNDFGLPPSVDVNTVLWHQVNDPTLGFVNASQAAVPVGPTLAPGNGAPGAVGGGVLTVATAPSGLPGTGPGAPGAAAPTALPTALAPAVSPTAPASSSSTTPGGGSFTTSPVLTTGAAGGSTTYSPPCSFIPVPSSVGLTISPGAFLSLFQPSASIFSAWKYDNASHAFQPIYFSDATAPVNSVSLHPGDVVSLCLSDNVQGPP